MCMAFSGERNTKCSFVYCKEIQFLFFMNFIYPFRLERSPFLILMLWVCIFIFVLAIGIFIVSFYNQTLTSITSRSTVTVPPLTIYGILITGKDTARLGMARQAVAQFFAQTHPQKQLIILNHGSEPVMHYSMQLHSDAIYEWRIQKDAHQLTLGDLRNMALNLVPYRSDGSVAWITWDDDDWRAPNYLELLHAAMHEHQADVVGYARRHECDMHADLEWVTELKTGFVHCLVRNDPRIRYQSKDTMEDTHLYDLFKKLKKRVYVIPSNQLPLDHVYYIRTIHGTNTSLYVKTHKKEIVSNPETATWRELSLDALPDVRLRIRKICQSILNPNS